MRCPGTPTHPLKYPQVPQGPDATPLPLQGSPGGAHGPGRIPPGIPRGGPEAHPELPLPAARPFWGLGSRGLLGTMLPLAAAAAGDFGPCRSAFGLRGAQCATRVGMESFGALPPSY